MSDVDPVATIRQLFDALLAGIAAVGETNADRAQVLLVDLGSAIDRQAPAVKRALKGDAEPGWSEPQAVLGGSGGTIRFAPPEMIL